jgi:uncharacterized protein YndB with AHSA1/START domain
VTDLLIDCDVVIEAPVDVVWRTITEPDQISQWFADRVQLDLQAGGAGILAFGDPVSTDAVTAPLVVTAVEPPQLFSFRWGHPDGEAPVAGNSVLVEFTLTPETGERTRLRVVETGLDVIGWPDEDKARYVEEHRHGWATFLGRLKDLLTAAAG